VSGFTDRTRVLVLVAVLVVVLFAGTALASYSAPSEGRSSTGRVLGKSGFAFLGGLRMFVAAVIWNRIDPVFHTYYNGVPLEKQAYMLPHLRLVTLLDPQFVQGYYMASYMVAKGGNMKQGIGIAEDGLKNNPTSGLMYANLAQLLMMQDAKGNLPKMIELAGKGMRSDVSWSTADDRYDGLVMFRGIYMLAKDDARVAAINKELDAIKAGGSLSNHDHNGDGVEDH